MKPDEPGFKLAYEYFMEAPGGFTYEEFKNLFGKAIQSALAERTEQCAKICDDRIAFVIEKMDQLKNPPVWDVSGYHVKTYSETCRLEAATIAKQIRALNTENKS